MSDPTAAADPEPIDVTRAEHLAAHGAVYLDVRTQPEWETGHLPGAIHLPLDQLRQQGGHLSGHTPLITICGSGNRAEQAAALLHKAGRTAYWLDGGLHAWTAAGRPVTTATATMTATEWDARYAGDALVWTAGPNQFLVEQTATLTPGTALDMACGEARNALWLARHGWHVTGLDFSITALRKAERLARAAEVTVELIHADALTWQPTVTNRPDGHTTGYDLVLIAYLQLPPDQRRHIIATAAAATAPGGSLLIIAHDKINISQGVGGPQNPDLLWTPDEIQLDGFTTLRRDTAIRPTGAGNAYDTVVHLRAANSK